MISMMMHHIENTLLLWWLMTYTNICWDKPRDWEWLKKFFYEHIFQSLGDKEKRLFHKAYSRNSLQQRNLISKFLYYSIVKKINKTKNLNYLLTLEPCLPKPTQEEKVHDPNYNHNFARWMLYGHLRIYRCLLEQIYWYLVVRHIHV